MYIIIFNIFFFHLYISSFLIWHNLVWTCTQNLIFNRDPNVTNINNQRKDVSRRRLARYKQRKRQLFIYTYKCGCYVITDRWSFLSSVCILMHGIMSKTIHVYDHHMLYKTKRWYYIQVTMSQATGTQILLLDCICLCIHIHTRTWE